MALKAAESSVIAAGNSNTLEVSSDNGTSNSATSSLPNNDHRANDDIVTEDATKDAPGNEETFGASAVEMKGNEDTEGSLEARDKGVDDEGEGDESVSSEDEELPVVESPSQDIRVRVLLPLHSPFDLPWLLERPNRCA